MKKTHSQKVNSLLAVLRAVQECRVKPLGDPQRIIVLMVAAGCRLPLVYCRALRRHGALLVEAGQLQKPRVGFLKLLVHRTRVVPVLLTGPGLWRDWNRRRPLEAAQIRRRTYMSVLLDEPSTEKN